MNNQEEVKVDNRYVDPKTGSGYIPSSSGNMDFTIALVFGILLIVIVGGGILLLTNEDVKDFISDGFDEIVESFEESFEDDYYDEDYEDDYYDEYEDELEDNYNDNLSYSIEDFKEIKASDIARESTNQIIVLWIGRQSCSYCKIYAPVIEEVADEFDVTVRYIDLEKIVNFKVAQPYISDQVAFDTISNLTGLGEWETFAEENVGATPLTLIIKNNEVIGGVAGYVVESVLTDVFVDAGLRK
jgi:thiol-disulfide isomerase/thioredoxin